jgi:hypothetical protein
VAAKVAADVQQQHSSSTTEQNTQRQNYEM